MSEVLVLERFDNSPWGFRLTGGLDFGTPITVLKVTGGSIAEMNGVRVGDLIVEINGHSAKNFTHIDAQNCIIESGNRLTLSVMRGSEVTPPGPTPLRGMTPLNGIEDYLSDINGVSHAQLVEKLHHFKQISHGYSVSTVSLKECDYESANEIQTNESVFSSDAEHLDGRILEKDPGDVSDLEIAELITGNEEVLEQGVLGINFKKYHPQVDFIRESEVFKLLQDENIHKEIPEEVQLKKDPTKRFSTFLMKPKPPPSPKPTGPYWHYPKAPRYLPREAEKPKEDPRRRIIREKGHTVLWLFLGESGEHVVDERWGTPEEERINLSRSEMRDDDQWSVASSELSKKDSHEGKSKAKKKEMVYDNLSNEMSSQSDLSHVEEISYSEENVGGILKPSGTSTRGTKVVFRQDQDQKDTMKTDDVTEQKNEEKGVSVSKSHINIEEEENHLSEIKSHLKETKLISEENTNIIEEAAMKETYGMSEIKQRGDSCSQEESYIVDEKKKLSEENVEKQLAEIQAKIAELEERAPKDLQTQLLEINDHLSKILQLQKSSSYQSNENNEVIEVEEIKVSSCEIKEVDELQTKSAEELCEYEDESNIANYSYEECVEVNNNGEELIEVNDTISQDMDIEHFKMGEYELCEALPETTQSKKKPKKQHPLTPQARPIVLPGGRMWRQPKDAAYEEFYQGILVEQADVLVGSDVGVNFRKYIPPKFDIENSAVCRLIHEIEERSKSKELVPEEEYYQGPISTRHFYAASLPAPEPRGYVNLDELGTDV